MKTTQKINTQFWQIYLYLHSIISFNLSGGIYIENALFFTRYIFEQIEEEHMFVIK